MSIGGLRWWNCWSRIDGALYLLRGTHPTFGWTIRAYVGKTFQHPWTKRIDQHLWGRGSYHNPAKPWADTVLGWTPNGTVDQVIAAGGCRLVWQGRCSPFGLWWREILLILLLRPKYNYQWNLANRSRITITQAQKQRNRRERGGRGPYPEPNRRREPVPVRQWGAALGAVGVVGLLLVPGVSAGIANTARWGWNNALGLLILAVFAIAAVTAPRRQRKR